MTAPGLKTGRVKFIDRHKGYGYIIDDEASSPRETILFTEAVASSAWRT